MAGYGADHPVGEVARIGGHEAQALQAGQDGGCVEQVGEVPIPTAAERRLGFAPVVHGLAQEFDLNEAVVQKVLDLAQDVRHRPAALRSPCVRDDAEGAALVAALDDRDHALVGGVPADRLEVVRAFVREADRQDALSIAAASENGPEFPYAAGTDDEVEIGNPAQRFFAFLLSHAAAESDPEVLTDPFEQPVLPQPGVGLLGRLLTNRAGVQEDQVGLLERARRQQALLHQLPGHALAVQFVHLAAPRLDVEAFHGAEITTPAAGSRRPAGPRDRAAP